MTPSSLIPCVQPPYFAHEQLDVYRAALDFLSLTHDIVAELPKGRSALADQLERAATSVALNTAEASGEFSRREKARIYRIAARSADECAAILDVGQRLHAIAPARVQEGKKLLGRILAMLTAMAHRLA